MSKANQLLTIKELIDEIDFHDLPVNAIGFDLDKRNITFSVSKFNEVTKEYDKLELIFENATTTSLAFGDILSIEEIYSYELEAAGRSFLFRIVFLTGYSRPSLTMEFNFASLVAIRQ